MINTKSKKLNIKNNIDKFYTSKNKEEDVKQVKKIKVLFAAFEASPFMKTGGLGDVAGALPKYLNEEDAEVRVVMPLFSSIKKEYRDKMVYKTNFNVPFGWRNQYLGLFELKYNNTIIYFLDNEYYFKRENAYGFFDDGERIAFFSKALLECIMYLDFDVDILHLNDWHTALSCVYLREMYQQIEKYRKIKTIFTVHNLKFQGKFDKNMIKDPVDLFKYKNARDQLLEKDDINFMLGGLNYADYITTVSKTYAQEVQNDFYGEGLQDIFKRRQNVFRGILNGIDYESYNPKTDKNILYNFDSNNFELKSKNKIELQKELSLNQDENVCMIGFISRLTEQKGIDLILPIFEEMINTLNVQFVLLGQGDKKYEDAFRYFENKYKGRVSSSICFSEERSRRIYASSDLYLMPSIFEPCGLSQIIAMRYLALPIVRETGGLKDTVVPFNKYTNEGTGFSFKNINAHELLWTVKDAVNLYYQNRDVFNILIKNTQLKDFSWKTSAKEYVKLYKEVLNESIV